MEILKEQLLRMPPCDVLGGLRGHNAEREQSRELEAGVPGADRELQLDARSAPRDQKTG